jgi:hypothetical protein
MISDRSRKGQPTEGVKSMLMSFRFLRFYVHVFSRTCGTGSTSTFRVFVEPLSLAVASTRVKHWGDAEVERRRCEDRSAVGGGV